MAKTKGLTFGLGAVLLTALAALGLSSCNSTLAEELELAQLAQNCLVNSDCSSPLVCAFEACHAECESSRDCDDGARCVAAARPYKVCQLEEERLCRRTSDCAEGLICGVDGECRDACLSDAECVEDQQCVSGTCADADELDASGRLEPAGGAKHGAEGSPCVYFSDCAGTLLCRNQACLAECKAGKDCPAGQVCDDARCVDDAAGPVACQFSSQCRTAEGERCLGGSCLCTCAEDRDCPSGQLCNGCGCQPDPEAPPVCAYHSDCAQAGSVCLNGTCACACQADVDCGANRKCDGCGCIDAPDPIHGVVYGRVVIESSLHLSLYRGISEVRGDLNITGAALADLGDTFAGLRRVSGMLRLHTNHTIEELDFPALEEASELVVENASLRALRAPALKSAQVQIFAAKQLSDLDLTALEQGGIHLSGAHALSQLQLPKARELRTFTLFEMPLMEVVSLPALTTVTSSFFIASNEAPIVSTLSAPQLRELGQLGLGGTFSLYNTKLTSLAEFGSADLSVHAAQITFNDNARLDTCAIDAFIARARAGGFAAQPELSGNLTCTCVGGVCAD